MPARVLVVDDVAANVKILEAKLTAEYFEVLTASNGRAALDLADAEQPDIILLDVMMPEMDGFEVCRRLKANTRTAHIPVVMVTALSDMGDRVTGLDAGADDFLTKPVNDLILLSRVKSLVRLKTSMDEWRLREATSGQLGGDLSAGAPVADDQLRGRVLVIESDPFGGEKICHLLEQKGCEAVLTATGKEGSQKCAAEDFDLVIVSLYLEDGDGLRLCSHLRSVEKTRRLPILLVIEPEEMGGLVKGFEIGVNDYLFRPIEGNELWARVRTQMRRKRYQDLMRENYTRSLSLALTDSLTGLYNRRYLEAHLQSMIERAQTSGKPLSLFMLDIDHFKKVNDTFGHAGGDEVLRRVGGLISHNLREFDLTARTGGEEFVVVMPDTPVAAAQMVADRMRVTIAETDMPLRGAATVEPQHVTISIGVAALRAGEGGEELLRRADEALYAAKNGGRNRVSVAPTDDAA